jgi:murein DD-endopeptidase MepM/ murein hydrolase activator NlpD
MNKHINILIIPEGREPSHNFRISVAVLKIGAAIFSIWLILLVVATVFLGKLLDKSRQAEVLRQENQLLREYNSKVVEIEKGFQKNRELTAKIAGLAGIELEQPKSGQSSIVDSVFPESAGRGSVSGMAGDDPALSSEELEKMRTPQGRPLYGWITRSFNADENNGKEKHEGVDIAVKEGTPVVATATGEVVFAGWDQDFGNMLIIDHGNGYKTVYGHNERLLVSLGDKIFKGKVIALSGNSGRSSAPHLHYQILKDGEPVDPSTFIE